MHSSADQCADAVAAVNMAGVATEGDDVGRGRESCGLGNLKVYRFRGGLVGNRGAVFDDAAGLLDGLKEAGIRVSVASARRNARRAPENARLARAFDAIVDGSGARERGLSPEPDPDHLIETARQLGCDREADVR